MVDGVMIIAVISTEGTYIAAADSATASAKDYSVGRFRHDDVG